MRQPTRIGAIGAAALQDFLVHIALFASALTGCNSPFPSLAGGNVPPGQGGPSMDDNGFPGGEKLGLDKETIWNVFPYKWNTTADYLEAAGVSWFVYQPNRK